MEVTECGAASLAMILEYYGRYVPMEQLRRECGVSRNGVNAKSIAKTAMHHALKPRALRADMDNIGDVKTPAIIHWNMEHFLVLCGFNKKGAVLADPAMGLRTVSLETFSRSFTGIVLEFTPTDEFEKTKKDKSAGGYIHSCIKPYMPVMAVFTAMEMCILIGNGIFPFIGSAYINSVIIKGNTSKLMFLIAALLSCAVIAAAAGALEAFAKNKTAKSLNASLNLGFIKHMLSLPIEFFSQRNAGELSMRQCESMTLGRTLTALLPAMPIYAMQAAIFLVLLVSMNVQTAAIGFISVIISAVSTVISSKLYREKLLTLDRDRSSFQSRISQTVDAIETIKSCGAEDVMFGRLTAEGTKVINSRTEIERTSILSSSLFTFLNSLSSVMVIIAGVRQIISGDITTGFLIALQGVTAAMLEPVGNAVNAGVNMQTLSGVISRTDDVMNYEKDTKFSDKESGAEIDGSAELCDITFRYNPLDEPFLKDFNLSVPKGGSIAITGGSGSGKSTAAKLISGLFREDGGRVIFGNAERGDIEHFCFYSRVASVSQSIRLFEGTVLDNITMFDDTIHYDDVVAAAKLACIHEDIISRPAGYRERVEENGRNFSGGQRQRLELARALVKKPSILIMDEATSALDADTEEKIMNALKDMGITLILVAHRLSAIRSCDKIIVMEYGEIIESGTHEELLKLGGAYSRLYSGEGAV